MAKTMENSTAYGTITKISWLLCPLTCRVVLYLCEAEFIQTLINSGKYILPNHFGTPRGIMLMCCPSTIPNLGITSMLYIASDNVISGNEPSSDILTSQSQIPE